MNKPQNRKILISSILVSGYLLLIKVAGLIKQSIVAAKFGSTFETDAFFISSGIVYSFGIAIFSAISISLLTIYTRYKKQNPSMANRLISDVIKVYFPVAILFAALFFCTSGIIARFIAPSYSEEQLMILSHYIKIMSISLCPLCLYLILNVLLESNKQFIQGRSYALFQNMFIIIAALLFSTGYGIKSLLIAYVLAALAEFVLVAYYARHLFTFQRGKIVEKGEIRNLLILALPLMLGNAIYEINDVVDKMISANLGVGSVSVLTYGQSINEIVSVVVITAVSTVLFAHYSSWIAEGNIEKLAGNLNDCVKIYILIMLPLICTSIICSNDIVTILFARGNFNAADTHQTSSVLIGYACGFIFVAIRSVFLKCLYAFQDVKRALYIGVVSVMINIILSIGLSKIIGVSGIGYGTSIAMGTATMLSYLAIRKHIAGFKLHGIMEYSIKTVIACGIMSVILIIFRDYLINLNVFARLLSCAVVSLIIYAASLFFMNERTLFGLLKKA